MLPGPFFIRKCNACPGVIKDHSFISCNTVGAEIWTDGYCEAPILPERPQLGKCPNCHTLIWSDDLEIIEEVEFDSTNNKYPDAKRYSWPEKDDFEKALNSIKLNDDEERYLRIQLWWVYNNSRRWELKKKDITNIEQENLSILLNLLNPDNSDELIMIIEILRELSRFNEAKIFSNKPIDDKYKYEIDFLRELIKIEDSFVKKFPNENHFLNDSVVLVTGE